MAGKVAFGPLSSSLLDQKHSRQAKTTTDELKNNPLVSGKLVGGTGGPDGTWIESAAGAGEIISHGLGRPVKGWIVVRLSADSAVTEPLREYADPTKTNLFIANDTAITVRYKLWVF